MRRETLLHALTLSHFVEPALHVGTIVRNRHLQRVAEIDNGDSGNVRYGTVAF